MMRRLVIAIDCDDVLMPTAEAILDDYNERFGTHVGFEHFYDTTDSSLHIWGVKSRDEAIGRVAEFLHSERHDNIVPDAEAIRAIPLLAAQHELHLVSGRMDSLKPATERMLQTHFPGFFKSIEHTNFITPLGSKLIRRSKGDLCKAINADILIDDHPHHGNSALAADIGRVILFGDYAWNKLSILPNNMVHCRDWPKVIAEVERYATR